MGPEGRWEVKDDYSYLMSRWGGIHQWKTGFDISYIPFKGDNMGSPLGSWTFPKDTVYNPNDPSTYPTQYTNSLPTYADIPTTHLSFYAQDDFQPARNLTLNLGLRYDLQRGSFNENIDDLERRIADKLGPGFGFPLPIPFLDGSNTRGDRNNFGPRAGLAWDPTGSGRTNIHAAYGMFYDNMRTLQNFNELTWPQSKTIVINNPSYPDPLQGKSRDQFISTAPPNITVFANDTVNPFAHQVNGGVTHMLAGDLALTADVTVTKRYSDRNTIDLNLPDPVTKVKPYPQFGRVSYGQPTADNDYKALLLKVEKRMSHRYSYLVSYTLSKATDTNFSNTYISPYGFSEDTIYAVADRRHRLVASGIVALPFEAQVSAILDLRSSLPFGPTSSLDLNGDGYTGDLPAGVIRMSGCRGLDLNAVNTFRSSRGLAPVTDVTCAGFSNLDIRFSKFLTLGGSHRVELIAQLFNAFDHANYGTPSNNLGSGNDPTTGRPLFGTATTLLPNINAPSRQVELAVRYQF
jgi:outer membrane receptor protein involved in Fe transport